MLGPNQAIVRFEGNGYTRAGRVQDMALYRCADLTVQRGFDAFVFASSSGDTATGYYVQHGQYSSTVIPIQKHTASATIAMFKKENAPLGAMDARTIMESLGPQLGIER